MSGNKLGNEGGMHMAAMLQVNETLETLDLADTDLVSIPHGCGRVIYVVRPGLPEPSTDCCNHPDVHAWQTLPGSLFTQFLNNILVEKR